MQRRSFIVSGTVRPYPDPVIQIHRLAPITSHGSVEIGCGYLVSLLDIGSCVRMDMGQAEDVSRHMNRLQRLRSVNSLVAASKLVTFQ